MVFTLPRGVTPVSHRKLSALAMEGYGVVMVTVPAKQTSAIPPLHRELQTEMRGPTSHLESLVWLPFSKLLVGGWRRRQLC